MANDLRNRTLPAALLALVGLASPLAFATPGTAQPSGRAAAEDAGERPTPQSEDPLAEFRAPDGMPAEVEDEARVVDRRGEQLPLDVIVDDELGRKVPLRTFFTSGRPVLLQFVYYRCPSLCSVVLNGTVDLLRRMEWTPGDQFEVVTISINPQETSNLARLKKTAYLKEYGRPEGARGWHFLTASEASIERLAEAAGFGYRFEQEMNEYAHGAALFVITPEGVVSRTIYGAMYDPQTARLSLVEAADGKVGSALDRVLLFCYHFDPLTGKYTTRIMDLVRVAGVALVLAIGLTVGTFLWRERRQRLALATHGAAEGTIDDTTVGMNTPAADGERPGAVGPSSSAPDVRPEA